MKTQVIFIFLICSVKLFCQDTMVAWIENIDTLAFKISYDKKYIPKKFCKYLDIDSLKQIANSNEQWNSGCKIRRGLLFKQLNWVAKGKKNHFVIGISHGGGKVGPKTYYYYFDYDNKNLNVNTLTFDHERLYTFGQTSAFVKNKKFRFILPKTQK